MTFHHVPLEYQFVSATSEELFIIWCDGNVEYLAVVCAFKGIDECALRRVPESDCSVPSVGVPTERTYTWQIPAQRGRIGSRPNNAVPAIPICSTTFLSEPGSCIVASLSIAAF